MELQMRRAGGQHTSVREDMNKPGAREVDKREDYKHREDTNKDTPCNKIQLARVANNPPQTDTGSTTTFKASSLLKSRFAKALRQNNRCGLKQCLEAGYRPTGKQWLNIISKMHVATALGCVATTQTMEPACISAAVRRQHRRLFKEVVNRVASIPRTQMESLMAVPAYYLEVCLQKGLDPNITLKNHRLPLEQACAHSRIAHIEILLADPRTIVSTTVCRFVIRHQQQQHFAERAIDLCDGIVPNMILEAVVANVNTALCSIMAKLEQKYEHNPIWDEITHLLRCPILSDYSTDLVKTPVNNHYYDRKQLLIWVRAKGTDPMTRAALQESELLLRTEFLSEYAVMLQKKIRKLEH
jgi:hypothetical protein